MSMPSRSRTPSTPTSSMSSRRDAAHVSRPSRKRSRSALRRGAASAWCRSARSRATGDPERARVVGERRRSSPARHRSRRTRGAAVAARISLPRPWPLLVLGRATSRSRTSAVVGNCSDVTTARRCRTTVAPDQRRSRTSATRRATCRRDSPTRSGTPARSSSGRLEVGPRHGERHRRRVVDRHARSSVASSIGEGVVDIAQREDAACAPRGRTAASTGAASPQCGYQSDREQVSLSTIAGRGIHPSRAGVVPRRHRRRPRRAGPAAAVRRHQPGAVDGGDGDPLRPPRQPLLPGAAAGGHHRPRDRPRRRHDRRRPRGTSSAAASASPTSWPGRRAGVRAVGGRAARRRRPARGVRRRAPAGGRRRRRRHRLPRRVRRPRRRLGRQPEPLGGAELWVVPNPSGLNAHETIDTLAAAYRAPRRSPPASSTAATGSTSVAATRSASARLARYQSIVARRPSSNGIGARQPSSCSARGWRRRAGGAGRRAWSGPSAARRRSRRGGRSSRPSRGSSPRGRCRG